jgi:hypothetical protein
MERIPEKLDKADDLNEMRAELSEDVFGFQSRLVEFTEHLRKKYPDYQNYRMYHFLVGSGALKPDERFTEDDFPGEDSIENFIKRLYQESRKKESE